MSNDDTLIAGAGGPICGAFRVPGDKSVSHRAIIFGALADGVTTVSGFLQSQDCLATLQVFRDMGVEIDDSGDGKLLIKGVGLHGLQQPGSDLNLGNSGTSMRLLAGLFCGQAFDCQLVGDESLSSRPMRRVTVPLATMGAAIETAPGGTPPMLIHGNQKLKGIHYDMPIASAQVKSSLLLAGLYAEGKTSVTEPAPTRDHTERMLRGFGYPLEVCGSKVTIEGGHSLKAAAIDVPADISSAAFFMVAASIVPGSDIVLQHVGVNPTRTGIINILRLMGANISLENERVVGGEPVADIHVRAAQLRGINIPETDVPLAIDEFPVLFVAAACAKGTTILTGAEELRVKESDRIQVMVDGLKRAGVDATATADGMIVRGAGEAGDPGSVQLAPIAGGCEITSHGDHRIAMSFIVASLVARKPITVKGCATIASSFPNFQTLANKVGFHIDNG